MKWSTLLPLAIISLIPSSSAWEIIWTDADNTEHQQSGQGPSPCIQINNPKGHLFKIDSQGEEGINMLLFANGKCTGEPAGRATTIFSKQSSQDLLGFQVVSLSASTHHDSTATAATTTTSTSSSSTGNSSTSASTTPTVSTSPSQSPSGSDKSMTIMTSSASVSVSRSASTTAKASSTPTNNASSKLVGGGIMGAVGVALGLML